MTVCKRVRGGNLIANLFQAGNTLASMVSRINPRDAANFAAGLAGVGGLAYGAKKLYDSKKKAEVEGRGLLNLPGTPYAAQAQRPVVPTGINTRLLTSRRS